MHPFQSHWINLSSSNTLSVFPRAQRSLYLHVLQHCASDLIYSHHMEHLHFLHPHIPHFSASQWATFTPCRVITCHRPVINVLVSASACINLPLKPRYIHGSLKLYSLHSIDGDHPRSACVCSSSDRGLQTPPHMQCHALHHSRDRLVNPASSSANSDFVAHETDT